MESFSFINTLECFLNQSNNNVIRFHKENLDSKERIDQRQETPEEPPPKQEDMDPLGTIGQ